MTELTLDQFYIREVAADIQAALFLLPREGEPQRHYPNPVAVRYQPNGDIDEEIIFISERTIQRVGEPVADTHASMVRVVLEEDSFVTDLTFGQEPNVTLSEYRESQAEAEAVNALLRAITGTL